MLLAGGANADLLKGLLRVFQAIECENYDDLKDVVTEAAIALGKTFEVTPAFNGAFGQLQKASAGRAQVYDPRLQIEKAVWGQGTESFDVTEQLRSAIRSNMLVVQASVTNFRDPCHGSPKRLSVKYIYDGEPRRADIAEHDWLALPV